MAYDLLSRLVLGLLIEVLWIFNLSVAYPLSNSNISSSSSTSGSLTCSIADGKCLELDLFSSVIEKYLSSYSYGFVCPIEFRVTPISLAEFSFLLELNIENMLNLPFIRLFPLFDYSLFHVLLSFSKSMLYC